MASTTIGTVVGYFATEAQAENAVTTLKSAGFSSSQIGIAMASDDQGPEREVASGTTVGSAAHAVGSKTKSAWESFKEFFEGSDVEPYADEKTRDTTHSHEITAGYENEDLTHSLSGLDVPEERSRYFGHRIGSQGRGAVVTVSAAGREDEAEAILEQAGGDVGSDTASYDYTEPVADSQHRIQLLGEVLRVHKDRVSRGEVRVRKEIITEQQTIQVPVTREELVIERIPVSGAAVAGEIGTDSEIRIPLTEEFASLNKHTVVREEVAIGKRAVENVQEVAGSVRHEELEVEDTTKVV